MDIILNRDGMRSAVTARFTQALRQQLLFSDTTPYGKLDVPPYRQGATLGRWTLRMQQSARTVIGYYSGMQRLRNNWILTEKRLGRDRIWMSVAPMELESQSYHALHAKGHVVIVGFGMGVLAFNVMRRPDVTRVTIIERDPAIIRIADKVIGWQDWEGSEKVTFVHKPWQTAHIDLCNTEVDVLLADPWPLLGDMNLRSDMQKMISRFNPKQITGWGVEFDFIDWMNSQGGSPIPKEGDWDSYSQEVFGGKLINPGEKPEYWAFIAVAQQAFESLDSAA